MTFPTSFLVLVDVYILAAFLPTVYGGDPAMQHPIKVTGPPSCLLSTQPDDSCSFSPTKQDQCTKNHCHVKLPTGCTDWWQVLNLTCFCAGMGKSDCVGRCPADLKRTMYFNWIYSSCKDIPSWSELPSTNDLHVPSSAKILSTDLSIQPPSCINASDVSAFRASYLSTSEVSQWIKDDLYSTSPWQFEQYYFCDNLIPTQVLNQSTCAIGSTIEHAQALIWMNTYCGTYKDFATQRMPSHWQDTIPLYQDKITDLSSHSLQDSWSSIEPANLCDADFSSHLASCSPRQKCPSLTDCSQPITTIDKDHFCSSSDTYQRPGLTWCGGSLAGQLKTRRFFEQVCGGTTGPLQAAFLLPWTEQVDSWVPDSSTNLAGRDVHCPTSAKLGAFAAVNVLVIFLVTLLGRRTLVNRLTSGLLGRINFQLWSVTGVIGVGLHLIGNLINAEIIQHTPGFGDTSVVHLSLLWCTRPRLAWLIAALVPIRADKAMYFSVAASTLITEFILQFFSVAYMGIATNYGRRTGFYRRRFLDQWGELAHPAKVMYTGSLMSTILFPFTLVACAWSIYSIKHRLGKIPTYLPCMQGTVTGLGQTAREQMTEIRRLEAALSGPPHHDPTTMESRHEPDDVEHQTQHLWQQCSTLHTHWHSLDASAIPIPQDLRRARREHVSRAGQENPDDPWFLEPEHQARDNEARSQNAQQKAAVVREDHAMVTRQTENHAREIQRLARREKSLTQRLKVGVAVSVQPTGTDSDDQIDSSSLNDDRATTAHPHQHAEDLTSTTHRLARLHALDAQHTKLAAVYTSVEASWTSLAAAHDTLARAWSQVHAERVAEADPALAVPARRYTLLPALLTTSLVLTWVAQWVWWAGYVRVARDTYCPPHLPALAAVWTTFEVGAAVLAACF